MESITIGYKRLGQVNGQTFYHKYILYTDSNGNQYYARGGPSKNPIGNPFGNLTNAQVGPGNLSGDSPFGNIVTEHGSYDMGTVDFDKVGNDPKEIVKTGQDLKNDWKNITDAFDNIASEKWPYRPVSQNSNTTVDEALDRAGLPSPHQSGWNDYWSPGSGAHLPAPGESTTPFGAEGDPYTGMPWPGTTISPTVGTSPDPLVKTIVYVDPLVLDLDGDGLEITPLSQGVLFDANGDAVKTGTAWVGSDDGLLVWDRNGNGTIDAGAELFGDETLLANGEKATHGFAALSELDTGSLVDGITVGAGDGVFDAQDAQYNTLRIWRDLNQDGVSQANELQTLAQSGTFTRTDGSKGQAGSFMLARNNFAREFVPITVGDVTSYFVRRKASTRTKCLGARTGIGSQQLFLQKLNLVDRCRPRSNLDK